MPGCLAKGGYGLTETSPVVSVANIKEHLADDPQDVQDRRKATAGCALAGVEIRVVDIHGNEVAHDGKEVGEVIVRSDVVMAG